MTTKEEPMEVFGILELALPTDGDPPKPLEAILSVENQELAGHAPGDGTVRFRFCPKSAKRFDFKIESTVSALDRKTGGIAAHLPSPDRATHPAAHLPNWWTDDPNPILAEGAHQGAKTVSRWREDFLRSFSERMNRCNAPASKQE
jgi:hypothetical protein